MPKKEVQDIDLDEQDFWDDTEIISMEEFKNLDRKDLPKNRKVDWDACLEEILTLGRPFGTPYLRKVAQKHSVSGEPIHLYYSEIERVLTKWTRDTDLVVTKRTRKTDRRNFYYILRKRED